MLSGSDGDFPVVPESLKADHTAFQTFLLHGVAIGMPNEAIRAATRMIEQNRLECEPEPYLRRASDLVAPILAPVLAMSGGPNDIRDAFGQMPDEIRKRLLPNIAALLGMGIRCWPDQGAGAVSAPAS